MFCPNSEKMVTTEALYSIGWSFYEDWGQYLYRKDCGPICRIRRDIIFAQSRKVQPKKANDSDVALILPVHNSPNFNICPQNQYQQIYQQPYQPALPATLWITISTPYQYTPPASVSQPATYPTNRPARNPPRRRNFTAIAIPRTEVFHRLIASGYISLMPAWPPPNPLPATYKRDTKYVSQSGQPGHDTESCWTLRNKV